MNLDTALSVWIYTCCVCMIVLVIIGLISAIGCWRFDRKLEKYYD